MRCGSCIWLSVIRKVYASRPGVSGSEALSPELCCCQEIPSRRCEGKDALCLRLCLSSTPSQGSVLTVTRTSQVGFLWVSCSPQQMTQLSLEKQQWAGRGKGSEAHGHSVPPETGLPQKRKQVAGFLPVPKSELECDGDRLGVGEGSRKGSNCGDRNRP